MRVAFAPVFSEFDMASAIPSALHSHRLFNLSETLP
jgi:hypothetical protein